MNKTTFNGKEFELSALRCKHLKQITKILEESRDPKQQNALSLLDKVERWFPYIGDSIRVKHPDFKNEELEEMTLVEAIKTWSLLLELSGIQIVASTGEPQPAPSTGVSSTAASAQEPAGPTVM